MKVFFKIFFLVLCLSPLSGRAVDGFYVGAQLGHVGLVSDSTATLSNALGYGAYFGVKPSGLVDLSFHFQTSTHSGGAGLTLLAPFISADFLVARLSEVEVEVGLGPGLYLLNAARSTSQFGLHFGGAMDVVVDDHFRVGLNFRYHRLLDSAALIGGFTNVQARASYQF